MRPLCRFLCLPPGERRLLIEALTAVSFVRLGLTALPFRIFRKYVLDCSRARPNSATAGQVTAGTVVWAVTVASRYVPMATCLTQALASQMILARHGYSTELRIGVTKDAHGSFGAHAWLELKGRVVIGDVDLANYTPLPARF